MRRIDLNLLYVLRELLKEPNTTKVAEKLSVSQSSVSASLARLRWAFQDELFVRSGRKMVPTRRAENLIDPVEEIIRNIEGLVEEVRFSPEKLQRQFTLVTTDFIRHRVGGPIISMMQSEAPSTRVIFGPLAVDTRERLRSGHLDLLIAPFDTILGKSEETSFQALYTDHLVAAVWEGTEKYDNTISEQQLLAESHLRFNPSMTSGAQSLADKFLEERGLRINAIAEFSTHESLVYALRHAEAVSILPKKMVDVLGQQTGVKALELPYDMPQYEVGLLWNRSYDNDPEHQWFREMVEKAGHYI
jgi:DNA-binding transcriptional LysR family regulator